ncbi:Uncharacterised protein [Klebsiella pneumoniae]|nr:Uncharacterised protein [Klebsiella pneumoniae]
MCSRCRCDWSRPIHEARRAAPAQPRRAPGADPLRRAGAGLRAVLRLAVLRALPDREAHDARQPRTGRGDLGSHARPPDARRARGLAAAPGTTHLPLSPRRRRARPAAGAGRRAGCRALHRTRPRRSISADPAQGGRQPSALPGPPAPARRQPADHRRHAGPGAAVRLAAAGAAGAVVPAAALHRPRGAHRHRPADPAGEGRGTSRSESSGTASRGNRPTRSGACSGGLQRHAGAHRRLPQGAHAIARGDFPRPADADHADEAARRVHGRLQRQGQAVE